MSTPVPPPLDDDARRSASARAVANRRSRAALKARVTARELTLAEAFEVADADPALRDTRVADLLTAVPRVGPKRAQRILRQCHVAEGRRVGGTGPRQREALVRAVAAPHVGDRR